MKKLVYLIVLITTSIFCLAQSDFEEIEKVPGDTACFKYKFQQGDLLIYRVESRDSIVFEDDTPLVRDRWERFIVKCDSVDKLGRFHLNLCFTDYTAAESKGEIKDVMRKTSPWVNRKFFLVIDSVSKRIRSVAGDVINAAVSPGGPFQPYLFFPFSQSCKAVNESWLVSSIDTLVENSFPPAIVEHSNLMRAEDKIDTLGYSCIRFRFIRTGEATYQVQSEQQSLLTSAIINSGGRLFISSEFSVPVHFFQTIEQKLRVYFDEDNYRVGKHFTNSYFTLEEFIRKNN